VDESVKRILRKKFEMGLFDDPYRYINPSREKSMLNRSENRVEAKSMAEKSIVLLKNTNQLLPLSKELKTVALIGPLVKAKKEQKGFWSLDIDPKEDIQSVMEAMEKAAPRTQFLYSFGCNIDDETRSGFAEAVATAQKADVVVMAMGEAPDMTGEAKSKANIHLPGVQEDLIKAVVATGKPVIVLLMAGRPMIFNWTADNAQAILYTWWLGSLGGSAISDVLYGAYNPSGKLPITFPRTEGQIPIYYNHFNTGRPPAGDKDVNYKSAYIDLPNSPRFAFGYGLSYTTFEYIDDDTFYSKAPLKDSEPLKISFTLKNTGKYAGAETVQLYIRDLVSQPLRPVKELKGFKKVFLQPGESQRVTFTVTRDMLYFYNDNLEYVTQPGDFQLMIGSASDDIRLKRTFELTN